MAFYQSILIYIFVELEAKTRVRFRAKAEVKARKITKNSVEIMLALVKALISSFLLEKEKFC